MLISFYFSKISWEISIISYLFAFIGDVVDGHVARAFNQCSTYGGVLDMVTDRVSTCDIFSHWFHVMSVSGHHKSKESLKHRNAILQWYYSIYPLFGYCCVGTELFYILLYVLNFYNNNILHQICYYVCLPACILKQLVNIVQWSSAAHAIASIDAESTSTKTQ
eukprot:gene19242-25093_t